ncbi:MAG: M18 family aminopeptidase [Acidiferrobacterales bacterium]|nr:M18 family aminopeptidase [Acidiferrobacterales bacterium]
MKKSTKELLHFLTHSPTPFHAIANIQSALDAAGFKQLHEDQDWGTLAKGRYYVCRNDSSMIAFSWSGNPQTQGFRMVGAHTDSPCLKVKPNAISVSQGYARLACEVYGGVLLAPWFDRDLGLAGRVSYADSKGKLKSCLVNFDRPLAFIPSLAIHLDREVNDKRSINKQTDLPAVLCKVDKQSPDFDALLKAQIKREHGRISVNRILGFELCLYDLQPAAVVGLEEEFIASARLDNLLSCHAGIEALLAAKNAANAMVVLNDHEEVGSASTSGAEGPFLQNVLTRLCGEEAVLQRALRHSLLVSADNAHGVHPNFADRHEPAHRPMMNEGPVIKINHNQRYATNSETEAAFREICHQNKLPVQTVVVRTDMGCGSTIGPITATRLGVATVDIGVPQLGMHSIRELAGVADQDVLRKALVGLFKMAPRVF